MRHESDENVSTAPQLKTPGSPLLPPNEGTVAIPIFNDDSEQPPLDDLKIMEALKELKTFWPFLLRAGINASSAAVISYLIANKEKGDGVELLGAYAAYQSAIGLSISFLYSSIFPVVTLMSDAKREEDDAIKTNNAPAITAAQEKMRAIWRQGIIFASLLTLPAIAFGLTASPLFKLFKQPDVVLENSRLYLAYSTPGFAADIFYRLTARTVTGLGIKKSILIADGFDNLIELGIAYAFLNGKFGLPDLGIAGVSAAYSISKLITVLSHLAYMYISPQCFKFDYTKYRLFQMDGAFYNKEIFKQLVSAGIPDGLNGAVSAISAMLVVMFCGQSGTAALVGIQTSNVYSGIMGLYGSAVFNAACNKIGGYFSIINDEDNKYSLQNKMTAAKNARTYTKLIMAFCSTLSLMACGLAFLIPKQLATLIIDENNSAHQAHLATAMTFLKIQGVFQVVNALNLVPLCVLGALLDNTFLLYMTIIFDLMCNPGAAATAQYGLHKSSEWVFGASGIGTALMTVALLWRCYSKLSFANRANEAVDTIRVENNPSPHSAGLFAKAKHALGLGNLELQTEKQALLAA